MLRKIASGLFLATGIVMAMGAYGHGFVGRLNIDAQLDKFPISTDVYTMLYVVWYFVSGCMVLFGATVVWAWLRLRKGEENLLFVTYLIGALYLAVGVGGMIYRHGDSFMAVFIVLGALLAASTFVLKSAPPSIGAGPAAAR